MATPPDFVFPELGDELAAGDSYYSGNIVFEYEGDSDIWAESDKPADA